MPSPPLSPTLSAALERGERHLPPGTTLGVCDHCGALTWVAPDAWPIATTGKGIVLLATAVVLVQSEAAKPAVEVMPSQRGLRAVEVGLVVCETCGGHDA